MALALSVLAAPFALMSAAAASAAVDVDETVCSSTGAGCLRQAPLLLQTRFEAGRELDGAMQTIEAEDGPPASGVPPLVPAFVSPPGADSSEHVAKKLGKSAAAAAAMGEELEALSSAQHTKRAWESFLLLKDLRRKGFTCPKGRHFPPNDGEFEFDCRLWRGILVHCQDMGNRNYFSHISPDGTDPFDRSEPYGFATFDENLAAGVSDAAGTMENWKKSDGHCTNMMDPKHNRAGVAYAHNGQSTYKHYWGQLFGSRNESPDSSCYASGGSRGTGGTPAPTPRPIAGGRGSGGARCSGSDSDNNCGAWASQGYCESGAHVDFMRSTCGASCCGGSGGAPAAPANCQDSHEHCSYYETQGYCRQSSQYFGFMQGECKRSCGFCR